MTINVQASAPFQIFQTKGATYTSNAAGLITNVALNDVKELVNDGCVVIQNGLIQSTPMQRILRASARALAFNPEDAAVSGATQAISTTHNAALTKAVTGQANAGSFKFTGGCVTWIPGSFTRACFPVASVLPATGGNIAGYFSNGTNQSNNAWGFAVDFVTDAPAIEIQVNGSSTIPFRIAVDGQYINKTPVTLGNSGINYITVTPAAAGNGNLTRANRRVTFESNSTNTFYGVNVAALDTVRPWVDPDNLRVAVTGDSYSEGQGVAQPGNSSWARTLGRLLGWADTRQVAVGSTGYIATSSGTRSTVTGQIPNWLTVNSDLSTFDIVVFAGGYNDAEVATAAAIQAAVTSALTLARSTFPTAVFFVLGSFGGARGPDAATLVCEAAIQAAVVALADPLTYFIPISSDVVSWFTGTGFQGATNASGNSDYYVYTDATHPNETGHAYLARLGAKVIRNVLSALPY